MLDANSQENQFRKRRASRPDTPIVDAFVGQMGNLVFNKVQVFEQAKAGMRVDKYVINIRCKRFFFRGNYKNPD